MTGLKYHCAAGFAQAIISLIAHMTGAGAGVPPISSAIPIRHQPESLTAATLRRIASDTVIVCSAGMNRGGFRSPSTNDSAIGPSDSRATSPRMSRTVAASRSPYAPESSTASRPRTSNKLNSRSRTFER